MMDIDKEDEVDSIMDEDEGEPESSEVGDGEHVREVDGNDDNKEEGTTPKFKGEKIGLGPICKVGAPQPRNMYLISPVEHLG
jgi:hypothetical protein